MVMEGPPKEMFREFVQVAMSQPNLDLRVEPREWNDTNIGNLNGLENLPVTDEMMHEF